MAINSEDGESSLVGGEPSEPFKLTGDILAKYPELKDLGDYLHEDGEEVRNSLIPRTLSTISAVFVNLNTVEDGLPAVEKGGPTIDILFHLDVAQTGLSELIRYRATYALHKPNDPAPKYSPFVEAEQKRFLEIRAHALAVIGTKVRQEDDVYR